MDEQTRQNLARLQPMMNESARLLIGCMPQLQIVHERLTDCPAACCALTEPEVRLINVAVGLARGILLQAQAYQFEGDSNG